MRATHIGRVDLNLVPALIALLEERHVSRAAARVGMSQPAMSRALQRLRRTLRDDLLVRTPEGYRLTPRGERILDRLATAVPQLEDVFAGADFDPSITELEIRVAGSDYAQAVIAPGLSGRIATASPGSTLRFRPWHRDVLTEVSDGAIDLAFIGAQTSEPLRSEELFTDRFVCVVSAGHPLAGRAALGLADYLGCRHLIIDVIDGRQPAIDRVLSAYGTPRRAGLILPVHAAAILALPGTDLVLTIPQRLAGHYASGGALRILQAPDEIGTMTYWMTWHPRLELDPVHRWLRRMVHDTVTGLPEDLRSA
ncbi:DNA-binding transcriptional LysR family regulator [Catenuloplanes nepalensis]|uniref:DNA-binding transcriptional LysR family regulator n=1 Tax=Catenuloplanes nepalensis TaxID=587533 RepID=A0ABT9MP21_9ACTN|nr:LysR family transcriptional regulator [Catenuloplanes nepalensis]MDP9793170.1 DNA-binding transcriptional LysR family regulator [Catenuloplanes nepalensis]